METSELGRIRHDLKNVMTALKSGCMLLDSGLPNDTDTELREILESMRAAIERASELISRLKEVEAR